jgi:GH18 family chitinase
MLPNQIPLGLWTHINVAFASVDPNTFHLVSQDGVPYSITEQVSRLKANDPSLNVYLSIGGWSFNDPGPTANTFSQLAASVSAQEAFSASIISFMAANGLDGVDIDW